MIVATALASVLFFAVALLKCGIIKTGHRVVGTARAAAAAMAANDLDDDGRERAVQGAALAMLGHAGLILVQGAAVMGAAVAPVLAADLVGLAPAGATLDHMMRWDFLLATTAAAAALVIWRRWQTSA